MKSRDRETLVEIVNAELVEPKAPVKIVKPSLIERLLSPQSLHWMMISGGGLLVIGFVVWLWSIGLFENPLTVAVAIGSGNLAMLGVGIWLYKATRYRLAGQGLTLLSSLLLPLHLWFYDAQGLISLAEGGQLWIPALICSMIYSLVARITRDPMFVYTLVGGVVLTGLLFLAGPSVGLFWSLLPTTTFLISVGVICIHADRWFQEPQGAFSRNEFGLAFFRAGQAVMIGGLALLLGGQVLPTVYRFFAFDDSFWGISQIVLSPTEKIASLGILLVASYTYVYSHLTRPIRFQFGIMAAGVAVWSMLLFLNLLGIQITFSAVMLVLGILLVAINVYHRTLKPQDDLTVERLANSMTRTFAPILASVLVLVAISQWAIANVSAETTFFLGWMHVFQMLAATVGCWTVPGVWPGAKRNVTSESSISFGAVGITFATMGIITSFVSLSFQVSVLIAMALPVLMSVTGSMLESSTVGNRVKLASVTSMTALMSFWVYLVLFRWILFATPINIMVMLIASTVYFHAGWSTGKRISMAPGFITGAIAVVQLFICLGITSAYSLILTATFAGITLLVVSTAISKVLQQRATSRLESKQSIAKSLHNAGDILIIVGLVGTILFALSDVLFGHVVVHQLGLLVFQLIPIGLGYLLADNSAWKQTYRLSAVATIITGIVGLTLLSELNLIQRMEIASLSFGAAMLVAGYLGWSRENEKKTDNVTVSFVIGSILMVLPMIIGLLNFRFFGIENADLVWRYVHEIGGLVIGLTLFGSGVLCRIRSTTLAGATLLATYVVSLLFLIRWPEQLQNASVLMMIGGATFFGVALLLSFYRDRILSLPEQVRDGRGVFRVFKWR